MGKWGYLINTFSVLFIIITNIFYCFPYGLPAEVPCVKQLRLPLQTLTLVISRTMNYNSVILAGVVFITTAWWFIHGSINYHGPHLPHLDEVGHTVAALK
jgi:choline transport protein